MVFPLESDLFFYAFRRYFSFNFFALFYLHTRRDTFGRDAEWTTTKQMVKRVTKGRNKKKYTTTVAIDIYIYIYVERCATSWASRKDFFFVYLRCSCVTFVFRKISFFLSTYTFFWYISCVCKLVSVISSLFLLLKVSCFVFNLHFIVIVIFNLIFDVGFFNFKLDIFCRYISAPALTLFLYLRFWRVRLYFSFSFSFLYFFFCFSTPHIRTVCRSINLNIYEIP